MPGFLFAYGWAADSKFRKTKHGTREFLKQWFGAMDRNPEVWQAILRVKWGNA
jgi:hypothetical protein